MNAAGNGIGFLAALDINPVAIGICVAAVVALYVAFKVGKFILKVLLVLAAVALIAWWYFFHYAAH